MLDASAGSETLFADHYVNLRAPHANDVIAAQLRETGLATLSGLTTRQEVLAFSSRMLTMTPHPHGAPDGLTLIHDTGSHAHRAGFAGFGSGELQAHTDRSGTPTPPRLILLVCLQPATAGGETLLADGREVHGRLMGENREAAVALCQPRTAYFGAGTGHATQVFTVQADGRISIRLRQDSLARWSPIVQPYLSTLRSAIATSQHRLLLQAGQGYLGSSARPERPSHRNTALESSESGRAISARWVHVLRRCGSSLKCFRNRAASAASRLRTLPTYRTVPSSVQGT